MSYARQKFYSALYTLVTEKSSLRSRLISAYSDSLICLAKEDLPEEILQEFHQLSIDITKFSDNGIRGSVVATVNKMDSYEVKRMVEKILLMYETVVKLEKFSS